MRETPLLEILIVTGPLGSGKTTLVNGLLKREIAQGRRMAVLINEFGAVSVDGALIESERPELAGVANLLSGCACCTLRPDVVGTLAEWADRPIESRPQRVILETTGLADPTDLVDLEAEPALRGRIRLAGCLTVISCLSPLHHLQQRILVHHQAALASLVYVSKADLDPSLAMAWESQLRAAFPTLAIACTRMGQVPAGSPDPWEGDGPAASKAGAASGPASAHRSQDFAGARALTVPLDHPLDPVGLEALFLGPVSPGELLRAKGVAAFAGWPSRTDGSDRWAFQVADGRVEITPLPPRPDGSLVEEVAVIIGTGLDFQAWAEALRALERPPAGSRRRAVLAAKRERS